MPTIRQGIETAFRKGYRVNGRGQVLGVRGRPLKLRLKTHKRKHGGYLYFTVRVGRNSHSRTVQVPVHRFVAFQKYGKRVFDSGVEVRHTGRSATDNRPKVIKLGTRHQNERDKPKHVRSNAVKKAWKTRRGS